MAPCTAARPAAVGSPPLDTGVAAGPAAPPPGAAAPPAAAGAAACRCRSLGRGLLGDLLGEGALNLGQGGLGLGARRRRALPGLVLGGDLTGLASALLSGLCLG